MAPRSRVKKSKARSSKKVDFISSLPENIKEKILTYLPIKEAGRTSVLSTAWRETWTSIPELRIHDYDCRNGRYECDIVKLVDTILLRRSCPIHKFELKTFSTRHDSFDGWIQNLSRNGIKEIKLHHLGSHSPYKIASSFFSCNALTSVCLTFCSVKLPVGFKGFELLQTLFMCCVIISEDCLEKLVSFCPMLENLKLKLPINCFVLNIKAPNLKILKINEDFKALSLHAPKLLYLRVSLTYDFSSHQLRNQSNIHQIFGSVPNLETLILRKCFVKSISSRQVVREFPVFFNNLKKLCIGLDMNFEDRNVAAFVMSLFKNAPNLEVLDVEMFYDWEERVVPVIPNLWDIEDFSFKRLRILNIDRYENLDNANEFMKFMLRSAPELLELSIRPPNYFYEDLKFYLNSLLEMPVASSEVRLIIK